MIARPTRTDWLLLLVLGVMWGTSYAFIKLGVENGLTTFTLITVRLSIGLVLVAPGLIGALSGSEFTGEVALLGSTLAYAVGAVYARRHIRGLRPMIPAVFQVGFAFVVVAVLAFTFEHPLGVAWNPSSILAVLWLGVLGSGAAYLLNFRLLNRIGATATAQLAYLLPVVGIITGAVMLGEQVDARVIGGTALILAGVTLVGSRYGERRIWGRTPARSAGSATSKPNA
jgi:drug/metabolite transporter (DMT)-like permease